MQIEVGFCGVNVANISEIIANFVLPVRQAGL